MAKVDSCVNCRINKLKCDGTLPCGSCSSSYASNLCKYGSSQRGKASKLYKKEACLPCRRKKKRCDANRPWCKKCVNSRKRDICVYDEDAPTGRKDARDFSVQLYSIERVSSESSLDDAISARDTVTTTELIPSSSTAPIKVNSRSAHLKIPSFPPQAIIPNPWLKVDNSGNPFTFALSEVSPNDLNMHFRLIFMSHQMIYGIYLPFNKRGALLMGDTSGTIIHPFMVHFAHLSGCQFYQERRGRYFLLPIQVGYLHQCLEALANMKEEDDTLQYVQANFYMGLAYAYTQTMHIAKRYIRKAVDCVKRKDIRFVPMSTGDASNSESRIVTPPQESFEITREKAALLAQIVYVENMFYLIGQPASLVGFYLEDHFKSELPRLYHDVYMQADQPAEISLDLESQFRYELPDAFPILFEICPIMLRVRSITLAKDASNLIAWFGQQTTPSKSWLSTCRTYLSHLADHIRDLTIGATESKQMNDEQSRLCLRFSSLVSLTNFAQIAFVLATSNATSASSASKFRDECTDALGRVVRIVEELEPGEFLTLESLLSITWSRALELFGDMGRPPEAHPLQSPSTDHPEASESSSSDGAQLASCIARIAQFNDEFLRNRYMPGSTTLCARLAEQNFQKPSKDKKT